jgi:putative NADH-flavin reductase
VTGRRGDVRGQPSVHDGTDMRLTILGATGRIGSLALDAAGRAGHPTVVLVRVMPESLPAGVRAVVGSIEDREAIRRAITGADAVLAALGPRTNSAAAAAELARGMRNLVEAMGAERVDRLVALSGAAVDVPGDRKPLLDRVASRIVNVAARNVVGAKQREFEIFSASPVAWTALRPPIVTDGSARGYRLSDQLQPGARVTRADVAQALIDVIDDQSSVRRAPFVLPR